MSMNKVGTYNFDDAKEKSARKYLIYHSEFNLTASNFLLTAPLKWHEFQPVSFTMVYSKLYILTDLDSNDVKFISTYRKKLDLSKDVYLWNRKFYICRDTAQFYEHKNAPRMYFFFYVLSQ